MKHYLNPNHLISVVTFKCTNCGLVIISNPISAKFHEDKNCGNLKVDNYRFKHLKVKE